MDLGSTRLDLLLPPSLLLCFYIVYTIISPRFYTEKQRAYILSVISSGTMTVISLPYVGQYLLQGLERCFEGAQSGWRKDLGSFGVLFFGTYLFGMLYLLLSGLVMSFKLRISADSAADLAIGYIKYPSQVGLLTGWIHHTVYIALMVYLRNTRLSPIFLIAAIMEFPTFDLALSNLFPSLRSDRRFLSSFFLIRIAFHLGYLIDCLRPSSRQVTDGSFVPVGMLALALVLHVSWFRGGLNGYMKRQRLSRKVQKIRSSELAEEEAEEQMEILNDPIIDTATNFGPTIPSTTLPSTPPLLAARNTTDEDDSPLLTPFTPGTTPMTLRDSYLFASLPTNLQTLTIPTFPTLPTVSIPSIPSLSDLTANLPLAAREFGFKEAVKNRWEEGRGRLGELRLAGGGAMGMLRRRAGGAEVTERETPRFTPVH